MLARLLINSRALLRKKHVAGCRITLRNKDVGPITLQLFYDVIVALVVFGLDYTV